MSYPPQPPYGQDPYPPQQGWPPQPGYPPPPGRGPRKPWPARHKVLTVLGAIAGLFVALIVIGAAAGGGKPAATTAASSPAASTAAAKSTAAAAPRITYVVTGTPGGADVTYGPEGSSLAGRVPMRVTKKLGDAGYYSVDAQLNGSGTVTVEILVGGKVLSRGTASGGYNIASAEISKDPFSGKWEDVQG